MNTLPDTNVLVWVRTAVTWFRRQFGREPEVWLVGNRFMLVVKEHPDTSFMTYDVVPDALEVPLSEEGDVF